MTDSLRLLLADARFPSGDPAHSGGMEAACAAGLVTDLTTLRSFLYGRLWTIGAVGAAAAAAVCSKANPDGRASSLFAAVEAELDARIHSPGARAASRDQGGQVLRLAITITEDPLFDTLSRTALSHRHRPHYPTAIGTVGAVCGVSPEEAAEAAAYAAIAGPAFAAQGLLGLGSQTIADLGVEMAPEVARLSREASQSAMGPLADMPASSAPALEYLAEEHLSTNLRSFAS